MSRDSNQFWPVLWYHHVNQSTQKMLLHATKLMWTVWWHRASLNDLTLIISMKTWISSTDLILDRKIVSQTCDRLLFASNTKANLISVWHRNYSTMFFDCGGFRMFDDDPELSRRQSKYPLVSPSMRGEMNLEGESISFDFSRVFWRHDLSMIPFSWHVSDLPCRGDRRQYYHRSVSFWHTEGSDYLP